MSHKCIYVGKHEHAPLIKIGMSENAESRLNSFKTWAGGNIELLYVTIPLKNARTIEHSIHKHFSEFRTVGEWFLMDATKVIEHIKTIEDLFIEGDIILPHEKFNFKEPVANLVSEQREVFKGVTEVEPFIYEDMYFYYYITYSVNETMFTIQFNSRRAARAFKKSYLANLVRISPDKR